MSEDAQDAAVEADSDADTDGDAGVSVDAETDASAADSDGDSGTGTAAERTAEDGEGLAEQVAAHDESLAAEVEALREERNALEADLREAESEVEDLTERLQRAKADFQNYKKRVQREQEQIRERATEDLVERLIEIRDNLARAVAEADSDEQADAAAVREGVAATLEEFDRVLAEENVEIIDPDPGEEVDPTRHQVMLRVDGNSPGGTIEEVYRPGYEMAGKVLREAQVTVSERDE